MMMEIVALTLAMVCLETASGISGPRLTPCSVMTSVLLKLTFPSFPPKTMMDWEWLIPTALYLLEVIKMGYILGLSICEYPKYPL